MTPPEGATSSEIAPPATPNKPADPAAQRKLQLYYLAAAIGCYLLFSILTPLIHFRLPHHRLTVVESVRLMLQYASIPTLIFMFLQLWLPWRFTKISQSIQSELKELAVFFTIWMLLMIGVPEKPGDTAFAMLFLSSVQTVAQTLTLTIGGAMLARIVREPKILLPLGFVAGLIDIVGAMTPVGFTHHMMQSHPSIVQHTALHAPTIGGLSVIPMMGIGDPVFIGFFFSVVHRHRLNERLTFRLFYVLLSLSMLAIQFRLVGAVGALAPMGIAAIVANRQYFNYSREEKFAMLYAGVICLAVVFGFFFYTHSHVFAHDDDGTPPRQMQTQAPRPAGTAVHHPVTKPRRTSP
jgi:hypothetical protein